MVEHISTTNTCYTTNTTNVEARRITSDTNITLPVSSIILPVDDVAIRDALHEVGAPNPFERQPAARDPRSARGPRAPAPRTPPTGAGASSSSPPTTWRPPRCSPLRCAAQRGNRQQPPVRPPTRARTHGRPKPDTPGTAPCLGV